MLDLVQQVVILVAGINALTMLLVILGISLFFDDINISITWRR